MNHLLRRSCASVAAATERVVGKNILRNTYKRSIHSSHVHQAAAVKRNKDLFTPSPFKRSEKIHIDDRFTVQRDLREGNDAYGIRRYLLLPRENNNDDSQNQTILASINANKNILFGAQLHSNHYDSDEDYIADYFATCEQLLDIAKEDASINGQQVQALATLKGLCSWVTECLDRDGGGSEVLTTLLHGTQSNKMLESTKDKAEASSGRHVKQNGQLILNNESDRILMLEAVRAIATGIPRPGHSVVGQGTYRDGAEGWKSLAWEYSNLAAVPFDASKGVMGLEEISLYKSRGGEVASIEHLASVDAEYLKVAGGAMARVFFV